MSIAGKRPKARAAKLLRHRYLFMSRAGTVVGRVVTVVVRAGATEDGV
jgi:hypothetical protein